MRYISRINKNIKMSAYKDGIEFVKLNELPPEDEM